MLPISAEDFSALAKARTATAVPVRRFVTDEPRLENGVLRDVVMSTSTVDRGRDVILQSGWKLANFLANPVLQWAHDYSLPPVGQVRGVEVIGDRLIGREIAFLDESLAPDGMPAEHLKFAMMIGRMYTHAARFLRAFSIGMRPERWAYNEERGGVDFIEQELLELSPCSIPMNQECLSGAKSAGIDMAPLLTLAEKRLDADPAAPAWLKANEASLVYRSLAAPRVAVPAPLNEEAIVQRVLSAVRAATPAPVPPPQPARPSPQQAAEFAAQYLSTRLAEITGRIPLND
jgi:hypothetical protein